MVDAGGEMPNVKDMVFAAGAHDKIQEMPREVRGDFGHALWLIQSGGTPANASQF